MAGVAARGLSHPKLIQRRPIHLQFSAELSYICRQLAAIFVHFPPGVHLAAKNVLRQLPRRDRVLPNGHTWEPYIYIRQIGPHWGMVPAVRLEPTVVGMA